MSREKYPGFVVTRTARKGPKRKNVSVDEDGLCEYSYMPCQHCHDELQLLSSSLKSCKAAVIHDHLTTCTGFMGERPPKRGKQSTSTLQNTAIVSNNDSNQELVALKAKAEELKDANDRLHRENAWLKSENVELEASVDNAQSALKSQRKRLSTALKSVDVHSQMGFPIMSLDNGLV